MNAEKSAFSLRIPEIVPLESLTPLLKQFEALRVKLKEIKRETCGCLNSLKELRLSDEKIKLVLVMVGSSVRPQVT